MIDKEELYKLVFYFVAAITASVIRFIRADKKNFPIFMVPAVVEHFQLSLYMGTGITWLLTMFSETVLNRFKKNLVKKIDDVTDTID